MGSYDGRPGPPIYDGLRPVGTRERLPCIVAGMAPKPKKPAKPARPAKAAAAPRPARDAAKPAGKKPAGKAPAAARRVDKARGAPDVAASDETLFAPLTPGEAADALRTLTEDRRLAGMAKVGRYRVVATEPLVVKPPHWIHNHRLARVVVYDYAADRCVDASVDLDAGVVAHLDITKAQPMLSREEEAVAVSVATQDDRVREKLALGDQPLVTMHYWGKDASDPAYTRRSAAVVFGRHGAHPSLVAVVDLLDNQVTAVVPAAQW
jgi:Cu2+-containing amine oxidase